MHQMNGQNVAIAACIPAMNYISRKDIIFNFGLCKTLFPWKGRHSLIVNSNFPHLLHFVKRRWPSNQIIAFLWRFARGHERFKIKIANYSCNETFVTLCSLVIHSPSLFRTSASRNFLFSSFVATKIYQHSAKDMSVNQGLLQDTDTGCNNNFTSNKRLAQTRDSGKLFLGTFDGVWVLFEVRTMRRKVDIILLQYMYSGNLSRLDCRIPSHLVCVFKFLLPPSRSYQININNWI